MQQLCYGICRCPQLEAMWVYFTPGINSWNEVVSGIMKGLLLSPGYWLCTLFAGTRLFSSREHKEDDEESTNGGKASE